MYWRLTLVAAIAVFLAGTHWKLYVMGMKAAKAEMQEQVIQAEQTARKKEQDLVAQRAQVERKYADEKRKAAVAASGAQSELDRLRDALAANSSATCESSTAPRGTNGGTRLEADLLGRCAATLVGVAEDADRLEAQIVGLQQYIKQVCLKQ